MDALGSTSSAPLIGREHIDLGGGSWLDLNRSWHCSSAEDFTQMWETCPKERIEIQMRGRKVPLPRFQRTYGDHGYNYSGQTTEADIWTTQLRRILERAEACACSKFNMCLVNYYAKDTY